MFSAGRLTDTDLDLGTSDMRKGKQRTKLLSVTFRFARVPTPVCTYMISRFFPVVKLLQS